MSLTRLPYPHRPQHNIKHLDQHIHNQQQRHPRHKHLDPLERLHRPNSRFNPSRAPNLFTAVDVRTHALVGGESVVLDKVLQEVVFLAPARE
jgi:hypothetical protein